MPPREPRARRRRRCSCFFLQDGSRSGYIRSVYTRPSEEEVMRLRCVNLRRAHRMLQLPTVYLRDVNRCKLTYSRCLHPLLNLVIFALWCALPATSLEREKKPSRRWHVYKPPPNYDGVFVLSDGFLYEIHPSLPHLPLTFFFLGGVCTYTNFPAGL